MPVSTDWGRRLDAVLADGEWHRFEDVVLDVMEAVPPGVAYRAGERQRTKSRSGRRGETVRQLGDRPRAVAAGKRHVARHALTGRISKGTVERDGDRVRRKA